MNKRERKRRVLWRRRGLARVEESWSEGLEAICPTSPVVQYCGEFDPEARAHGSFVLFRVRQRMAQQRTRCHSDLAGTGFNGSSLCPPHFSMRYQCSATGRSSPLSPSGFRRHRRGVRVAREEGLRGLTERQLARPGGCGPAKAMKVQLVFEIRRRFRAFGRLRFVRGVVV